MFSKNKPIVIVAALIGLYACSVKEDRSACPCYLTVEPQDVLLGDGEAASYFLDVSGARSFHYSMPLSEADCMDEFVLEVPRPNVFLSVYSGDASCFVPGEGVRIPEGEDCPPLYMYSQRIRTDGETARAHPVLSKQFCALTVKIVPVNDVFLSSFHLLIEGGVAGYELDSTLHPGVFRYVSYPDADGFCRARIPRQGDSSLMMTVREEGKELRHFALGAFIEQSGYDWTAEDLDDIFMEIDYTATAFTLRVNGWETTIEREILI